MKLFHVNREYNVIEKFTPRQPELSLSDDEVKAKRICLSSTVDGCFSSIYCGCTELKYSMLFSRDYDDDNFNPLTDEGKHAKFHLYIFDTNLITPQNLITPPKLKSDKLVGEALINKEHWVINQSIFPEEIFEIEVYDFEINKLQFISIKNVQKTLGCNVNVRGKITGRYISNNGKLTKIDSPNNSRIVVFDKYLEKYYK